MARKTSEVESNTSEGKQLINIGEQRREWVRKVSEAAVVPINEVMRCLIDEHIHEDPEIFATKIRKYQAKQRLEDVERRERALRAEKEQLVAELEKTGELTRTGK